MDQISQIKQNLNIVDIVGSYLDLKKSGRNYKAPCPFHSEKSPSFMVSAELQLYKCFGCGESGDMFEFVQKIEGIDFYKSLELLAEKAGVKLEKKKLDPNSQKKKLIYEINELTCKLYEHMLLKHKVGQQGKEYAMKTRGMTKETINAFRIGFAPDNWDTLFRFLTTKGYKPSDLEEAGVIVKSKRGNYIDKFRNRLMFPLIDTDTKVIGYTGRALGEEQPKYLNSPETLIFHKSSYIFGLDKARIKIKKLGAVFVEGQMDVVSAYQNGISNVIATSGTSLTNIQLGILARYTNEITFCFDPDSAGTSATYRAIDLAEKNNFEIKVCRIPSEFADLDELVRNDKARAIRLLEDTISVYDFFILTALKKFDKKSAYGKKKIVAEVGPQLKKISNSVVLDHHISQLANELEIDKKTLEELISKGEEYENIDEKTNKTDNSIANINKDISTEEYLIALLFNSKLEVTQNILYKLGRKDFTNEIVRDIFIEFKEYIKNRKKRFNAKYLIKKLNKDIKEKAESLYMWDLADLIENETLLEKEIISSFRRIKRDTISRVLKEYEQQMKAAEREKDSDKLMELSKKVYKISKLKKKYE